MIDMFTIQYGRVFSGFHLIKIPRTYLICFSSKVTNITSVHLVASKYFINWNKFKIGLSNYAPFISKEIYIDLRRRISPELIRNEWSKQIKSYRYYIKSFTHLITSYNFRHFLFSSIEKFGGNIKSLSKSLLIHTICNSNLDMDDRIRLGGILEYFQEVTKFELKF